MAEKSILPAIWDVPPIFRKRLGAKAGRQRAMFSDGHLLLVLHLPPRPEDDERIGRFFWRSPDGTWRSNDLGSGLGAIEKHLNQFAEIVEEYDNREEQATSAEEYFAVIEGLAPIHRAGRHMHQALQEARQLCPEDRDIINFRDRAYDIERTAELVYHGAQNSLDYIVARQTEEQARSSHQMAIAAHRLNLLAAFFFPIATLSAVFGVNLLHGYEQVPPPIPFLAVMACGLLMGVVLTRFVVIGSGNKNNKNNSPGRGGV